MPSTLPITLVLTLAASTFTHALPAAAVPPPPFFPIPPKGVPSGPSVPFPFPTGPAFPFPSATGVPAFPFPTATGRPEYSALPIFDEPAKTLSLAYGLAPTRVPEFEAKVPGQEGEGMGEVEIPPAPTGGEYESPPFNPFPTRPVPTGVFPPFPLPTGVFPPFPFPTGGLPIPTGDFPFPTGALPTTLSKIIRVPQPTGILPS